MKKFWCVIPYFNPAKYEALQRNWSIFTHELRRKKINHVTVELSFDGSYDIPESFDVIRLRSNSVMWQKERLINHGVSLLPSSCEYYAWLDCDVLFEMDDWVDQAVYKLDSNDIIQLFKRVYYMPKDCESFDGRYDTMVQGVIWQNLTHKNWLERRRTKCLPFSSPGFAWAARRDFVLYDKNIVGSGDTFIVDCLLGSWDIHGFAKKFTPKMREHMMNWCSQLPNLKYDYIPQSIYHLYHGSLKNRGYMDRHDILIDNDFDPTTDIRYENNVLEWNTDKQDLHDRIRKYFYDRKEDE